MKDNKGVKFLLTTVIGGVLFLVPVVFLGIMLTKAAGFMMVIAEPLAEGWRRPVTGCNHVSPPPMFAPTGNNPTKELELLQRC